MQNVSSEFINTAESKNRTLAHDVKVAWEKSYDDTLTFAQVDISLVGSNDIVQGELDVLTKPDFYQYTDEKRAVIALETTSEVEEPNGSVYYNYGSVIFNNGDGRFNSEGGSPIKDYILPKRPIKMFMGFRVGSTEKTIPMIYGIGKAPFVSNSTATFGIFDYLSYIQNFELGNDQMYVNKSTDEIIDIILQQIGFDSSQYELDQGLNRIKFVFFPKGSNAGTIIKKLCEAEEGFLYQTEQGLIKFSNRMSYKVAPYNSPVATIDESMILDHQAMSNVFVINRVVVKSMPRAVQDTTEIWTGEGVQLNPGETIEIWANLTDPAYFIEDMLLVGASDDVDLIANTAFDGVGTDITASINVSLTKFSQAALIEIENTSNFVAYLTKLRLRGNPATVISEIEVTANDTDSQDLYDINTLEIRNDYIDNPDFARYIARGIIKKYGSPKRRKQITIRALPYLQVRDMVTLDLNGEEVDYRILKITTRMEAGSFNQILVLREITPDEADTAAIVGISVVDGDDVVV